ENIDGLGAPTIMAADVTVADLADPSKNGQVGSRVMQAFAQLRGALSKNYVPASDRVAFVTPDVYSAIVASLQPYSAQFDGLVNQQTGVLNNISGFTVIEVPHLTQGGGDGKHAFPTTASAAGALKVNKTNVLALVAHRSAVGTVKLKDLSLERARRPEYQADEIIGRYAMGHGILRPEAVAAVVVKS
ncbi:UNVERIFIED_CONTAM: hypothetical protein RF648_21330, partial [Kocuria sp. CPCC 205274]